jgi:hypothetical protein
MHWQLSPPGVMAARTLAVLVALACTASVVTFSARAMQGPDSARVVAPAKASAVLADVGSANLGATPGLRTVKVPALRLPKPKPAPKPAAPSTPATPPLTTLVTAPTPIAAPAPVAARAPAPAPRPAPAPAPARGPSFDSSG